MSEDRSLGNRKNEPHRRILWLRSENTEDVLQREALLDRVFGRDRTQRLVTYLLRSNKEALPLLCFSAILEETGLVGNLRFWSVQVHHRVALLLGPLAVAPELVGQGIGHALVSLGLDEARRQGYRVCFLVGDTTYYRKWGFAPAPERFVLPRPAPANRFQYVELVSGAARHLSGTLQPAL